ncbi:zinc-dependent alcohol dehydrogenase family protein [Ramlibacter sp. AN1015]|uniref:zinc-dependent alcohol dehydrogenase family protein n=1 Tax=Ramlibacter sp. AN1015 TaxID=3133428 RepID=UPI0030C31EF6
MQAIVLRAPGGPEVLELQDLPLPQPGPGQVRVRAMAIGVGRPDALIRTGRYKWMPPLPAVPGNEMAGIVDALGQGVTELQAGQRVLLSSRELPQRGGCYAEYACAPAAALYPLPEGIGFDEAVSLPNFQLAQALLFHCGGTREPRSVLLTGAAGGVASAMVQLARASGLQVIVTASTEAKRAFAMSNGAHAALDPAAGDLAAQVHGLTDGRGVDLAIDPVGGSLLMQCLDCLAPLGTAVSYNVVGGPPAGDVFAALRHHLGKSLGVRVFSMHTFDADPALRRGLMSRSIEAMAGGRVQAPAARVLKLAEAREAHRLLDAPDTLGKIILHP